MPVNKLLRVSPQQVSEWIENPVTLALKEFCRNEIEETIRLKGLDAFAPFQPERTQEILANLNGMRDAWETIEGALSESDELMALFEGEEDEQDGD